MRYLKAILIFLLIVFNVSCFANNSKSSNAKNSVTKIQKTKESTGNMFDELENRAPYDFQKDWNKNVEKFENRWKQASIEREKEREKSNANWKKSQDEWNSSDAFWNKTPKKLEEKPAKEVDNEHEVPDYISNPKEHAEKFSRDANNAILTVLSLLGFVVLCLANKEHISYGGNGGKTGSSKSRKEGTGEFSKWTHLRPSYMHRIRILRSRR